jgi:hypothetical protein
MSRNRSISPASGVKGIGIWPTRCMEVAIASQGETEDEARAPRAPACFFSAKPDRDIPAANRRNQSRTGFLTGLPATRCRHRLYKGSEKWVHHALKRGAFRLEQGRDEKWMAFKLHHTHLILAIHTTDVQSTGLQ